jgi:hypothetical protein
MDVGLKEGFKKAFVSLKASESLKCRQLKRQSGPGSNLTIDVGSDEKISQS